MTHDNPTPVLIETRPSANGCRIGVATLNAPQSINSLNLAMLNILLPQLQAWQDDPEIACVLLRGSGDRGFCAGGDVVQLRDSSLAGDGEAAKFFEQEYRLDYLIHVYSKPILVWGHGVVMGGGLGLLAGASHRVVTAKTRLAMPEVTIGLYPDVGASWFLHRMPGRSGLFIALTGVFLNAGDTLYLGLADHFLGHEQWHELLARLAELAWQAPSQRGAQLSHLLSHLSAAAGEPPGSPLRAHYDRIQAITAAPTLDEIVAGIGNCQGEDEWLAAAARSLQAGCPTSLRLIYEQLRRSLHMSLREALQMEMVLSANCMIFPNFAEGVRALLVDKDRQPRFQPESLEAVSEELVARHFKPPWEGVNPLSDLC